jgi:NitT/TauT family transport system ATP-binding protein
MRQRWAEDNPDVVRRLVRAHQRAADFIEDADNRDEVAALLAAPHRIGVEAEVIRRTLDGRLKISPQGAYRDDPRYLLIGRANAARPDPVQAAWLYAQMVRWGQAPLSREMLAAANAVWRPDLYDAAIGAPTAPSRGEPADGIGAFAGPPFNANDIEAHLGAWTIRRVRFA